MPRARNQHPRPPSRPRTPQGLRDRWLCEKRHQLEAVDGLAPLAAELGCSLAQLALAWCARNPRVSTVITGATSVKQARPRGAAAAGAGGAGVWGGARVCGAAARGPGARPCLALWLRPPWTSPPPPAQVRENFEALSFVPKLTPDVVARVDAVLAAAAPRDAAA